MTRQQFIKNNQGLYAEGIEDPTEREVCECYFPFRFVSFRFVSENSAGFVSPSIPCFCVATSRPTV